MAQKTTSLTSIIQDDDGAVQVKKTKHKQAFRSTLNWNNLGSSGPRYHGHGIRCMHGSPVIGLQSQL